MSLCYLKGVLGFSRNPQKSHFLTVLVVRSCFKNLGAVYFEPSSLHSFTLTFPCLPPRDVKQLLGLPRASINAQEEPATFIPGGEDEVRLCFEGIAHGFLL